jgi:beta-lactam-binding protein with PASTA domain
VYSLCLLLVEALTGQVPFGGDSTVATLANRVDKLLPVSADHGPLAAVLERAGRPDATDRSTAAELGRGLVAAAEKLPRPAPLELFSTGLFSETGLAAAPVSSVPAGPPTFATEVVATPSSPNPPDVSPEVPTVPLSRPVAPFDAPSGQVPVIAPAPSGVSDPALLHTPPQRTGGPEPTAVLPGVVRPAATPPAVGRAGAGPADIDVPPPPQPDVSAPILREPRSRRRFLVVALLVVLAAGIGGGLAWWFGRDQPNDVPELVGLDKDEALNRISEFGWETEVVTELSDTVAIGVVIRTEPTAGASLSEGDAFVIVASGGPEPRTLPELSGLTVEAATAQLEALQLQLQVTEQPNDEVVPLGTVISWSIVDAPGVAAGDDVMPGTVVQVVVSAGPAPRTVPDLTGLTLADATAQLTELGLVVTAVPDEFSPTVAVGGVARQDPPPGTSVERGAAVTIAISHRHRSRPRHRPRARAEPGVARRRRSSSTTSVATPTAPAADESPAEQVVTGDQSPWAARPSPTATSVARRGKAPSAWSTGDRDVRRPPRRRQQRRHPARPRAGQHDRGGVGRGHQRAPQGHVRAQPLGRRLLA